MSSHIFVLTATLHTPRNKIARPTSRHTSGLIRTHCIFGRKKKANATPTTQFVTSMAMLQNAANEASRAGLAYFDLVAHGVPIGIGMNGEGMHYARAMSLPPGRAMTEEPEYDGLKRKRKRSAKPKDPNAPKKPATPFFLFCSQGRATVKSDMGEGTEFRDIQAELKKRWEELPIEEKRVRFAPACVE